MCVCGCACVCVCVTKKHSITIQYKSPVYVCMYVCMYVGALTSLRADTNGHDGQQFSLNPYVPSGLFHPNQWEESISKFGVSGGCTLFIFILFQIEIPVNKQCRA